MEWISVKDRLPEKGQVVLCLLRNDLKCIFLNGMPVFPQRVLLFDDKPIGKELFMDDRYYSYQPIHWMPLPAPPTE